MKRIIVDYKNLNHALLSLLSEKFPDNYGDDDIVTFSNANGDLIEAIEIRTQDVIYLVKISKKMKEVVRDLKRMILLKDFLIKKNKRRKLQNRLYAFICWWSQNSFNK